MERHSKKWSGRQEDKSRDVRKIQNQDTVSVLSSNPDKGGAQGEASSYELQGAAVPSPDFCSWENYLSNLRVDTQAVIIFNSQEMTRSATLSSACALGG